MLRCFRATTLCMDVILGHIVALGSKEVPVIRVIYDIQFREHNLNSFFFSLSLSQVSLCLALAVVSRVHTKKKPFIIIETKITGNEFL